MEEKKMENQKDDEDEFFCCDEFPFFDCRESFSQPIDSSDDVSSCSSVTAQNSQPFPGILSSGNLRRRHRQAPGAVSGWLNDADPSVSFGSSYVNAMVGDCELLPAIIGVKKELEHACENSSEESKHNSRSKSDHCKNEVLDEESSRNPKVAEEDNDPIEGDEESSAISGVIFKRHDEGRPVVINANQERIKDIPEDDMRKQENFASVDDSFIGKDCYVEDNMCSGENRDANASFLLVLAALVIRAIGFQFTVLVNLFMLPVWLIYLSYTIVIDPFHAVRKCGKYLISRVTGLLDYVRGCISAFLFLEGHKSVLKLGLKLGWGLLCAVYVCVVLLCMLVAAFVVGGILVKALVEEPIRMTENLNFDYTEISPVAFVPVAEFPGAKCGLGCSGKAVGAKLGGVDGLPPEHKLQVTVLLTLPESDYNRNLGIFEVRVDFLGADGTVLASSRRPCMLHFNSEPIRLLFTFFKMAPLLTGYSSESQLLKIKFRDFAHGGKPITCLRVMIEQRAQFQPGDGIPEVYSASLSLESEQPFLKRILWYWKSTVFVWISMTIFAAELLIALAFCKSVILPRVKLGVNSANDGSQRDSDPTQR